MQERVITYMGLFDKIAAFRAQQKGKSGKAKSQKSQESQTEISIQNSYKIVVTSGSGGEVTGKSQNYPRVTYFGDSTSGSALYDYTTKSSIYEHITNPPALATSLSQWQNIRAVAIDIKATGPEPSRDKIRLLQLAVENHPVLLIDLFALYETELEPVKQFLLRDDVIKIFHDAKSILKALQHVGIEVGGRIFDTMLSAQLLSSGLRKDRFEFYDLIIEYMGEGINKRSEENAWSKELLSISQLNSVANETRLLWRLASKLRDLLKGARLGDVAVLEFECVPAVVQMELNGMRIDSEKLAALKARLEIEKMRLEKTLHDFVGDVNLNSPEQLLDALESRGIPIDRAKKNHLTHISEQFPIVECVIQYRRIAALYNLSQGLSRAVRSDTGRAHAEYTQIGAGTGRLSCSSPNLQGVPKDESFRSCIIPEVGNKLVIADYSQMELRVIAEISNDNQMINAFKSGQDLHRLTASIVTEKSIDQVTDDERQKAKAINFGLIYAMGAEGLKEYAKINYDVDITLDEASTFRSRFFTAYSGIASWHRSIKKKNQKEARTLSGRRRQWKDKARITELYNTPIQGTAADIVKCALGMLRSELCGTGAKIIGSVHDEIILEAPEEYAHRAADILEEVMVEAGNRYLKRVPVAVDVKVADSWAEK